MTIKRTVLVIGSTGQQGGAVVRALLPKGHQVLAFTRNSESPSAKKLAEQGVDVIQGDMSDSASLVKAMTGIDTVFAMTTPFEVGIEGEIKQGIAIADAVKEAGVGHLIFSSVGSADRTTGISHFDSKYEVEKHIVSLGVPYTLSAPVYFMDNILAAWTIPSLKEGKLTLAMPANRALQQVSVKDIGTFGATMVERREEVFGKRIDIAGDELIGEETAAILSKASGRQIVFEGFDPEYLRKDSEDMFSMFKWFDQVGFSANIDELRRDYPQVGWQRLEEWANEQDWSVVA